MRKKLLALCACLLCSLAYGAPVDRIGSLYVEDGQVKGSVTGQSAQLRGMSLYWSQGKAGAPFYNESVVDWLATDWQVDMVRAAMGVEAWWSDAEKGYEYEPAINKARVTAVVDAALAKGLYVIIDWHSHYSEDMGKPERRAAAQAFFAEMATAYGSNPNVIYEVFNEPITGDWSNVRSYDSAVVATIRSIDPDNLIILGTPTYSSRPDLATADPVLMADGSQPVNVAYSFHFYASETWHWDHYRQYAQTALDRGYALFVSEWGLSPASGNGGIDATLLSGWFAWMEERKLCWAAWSLSNASESSAALTSAAATTGGWSESQLTQSGKWLRGKLKELNPEWSATPVKATVAARALQVSVNGSGAEKQVLLEYTPGLYSQATLRALDGRVLASTSLSPLSSSQVLSTGYRGVAILQLEGGSSPVRRSVMLP